jgi:hypothetical protein
MIDFFISAKRGSRSGHSLERWVSEVTCNKQLCPGGNSRSLFEDLDLAHLRCLDLKFRSSPMSDYISTVVAAAISSDLGWIVQEYIYCSSVIGDQSRLYLGLVCISSSLVISRHLQRNKKVVAVHCVVDIITTLRGLHSSLLSPLVIRNFCEDTYQYLMACGDRSGPFMVNYVMSNDVSLGSSVHKFFD